MNSEYMHVPAGLASYIHNVVRPGWDDKSVYTLRRSLPLEVARMADYVKAVVIEANREASWQTTGLLVIERKATWFLDSGLTGQNLTEIDSPEDTLTLTEKTPSVGSRFMQIIYEVRSIGIETPDTDEIRQICGLTRNVRESSWFRGT